MSLGYSSTLLASKAGECAGSLVSDENMELARLATILMYKFLSVLRLPFGKLTNETTDSDSLSQHKLSKVVIHTSRFIEISMIGWLFLGITEKKKRFVGDKPYYLLFISMNN